ncbi:hypothetical protein EDC55_10285 [Allofrancisella inopinata]|uniref:Uncharacterized protein n=1 Tax=Allofrancisella inopinata TaxID=1085647 RepID=A0AAE6YIC6_9GAMM|nr:hypothetical protein [Allofrancisella inopinata]QIV95977.1 hypothetical protein E4K63_03685 [Allofrancisella inopinata]TDT74399.1 hypothetical protein EDC55_10285 [Allofrancisella inopinata]
MSLESLKNDIITQIQLYCNRRWTNHRSRAIEVIDAVNQARNIKQLEYLIDNEILLLKYGTHINNNQNQFDYYTSKRHPKSNNHFLFSHMKNRNYRNPDNSAYKGCLDSIKNSIMKEKSITRIQSYIRGFSSRNNNFKPKLAWQKYYSQCSFQEMDMEEIKALVTFKGKKLGQGSFGQVYSFNGKVYKFFIEEDCGGEETRAVRTSRILCSLSINKKSNFSPKAVGKDQKVLEMPVIEVMDSKNRNIGDLFTIARSLDDDKRFMADLCPENVGYLNKKLVVFDADNIVDFNLNENSSFISKEYFQDFVERGIVKNGSVQPNMDLMLKS